MSAPANIVPMRDTATLPGQRLIRLLLSAAAQRPGKHANHILTQIEDGAWQRNEYRYDRDEMRAWLSLGLDHPQVEANRRALLDRYGYDGDPDNLRVYAEELGALYREVRIASVPGIEEHLDRAAPLLSPSDLRGWQALAEEHIDSVFCEGLAAGTMGVLAGEGGGGKSYLALQLALSVAIGRRLIKGFSPAQRGRVLCLFGEDDRHIVAQRLQACCNALPLSPADVDGALNNDRLELVCGTAAPLLDRETGARSRAYRELEARCADNEYRLVVVDPLVSFAGVANENDNTEMQRAALALVDLAKASGGAVLAVHHANKSGAKAGDTSQGLARGASSLLCAARWVAALRVLSETDAKRHDIPFDEIERYVEVKVSKNSYAPSAGHRYHLRREEGGALVPVDLAEKGLIRLATAIAEELGADGGFTRYEVAKGTAAAHKALRDRVAQRTGADAGRDGMNEAICYGLRHGLLVEAEVKSHRPGAKRIELLAKM